MLDARGQIVNNQGMLLEPEIPVPPHTFNIHVGNDGKITGVVDGEPEVLGQIQLAEFDNPHGLEQGGDNLFFASEASGEPRTGVPGTNGLVIIQSGMLKGLMQISLMQ